MSNDAAMARRRKKRVVRPRVPARVRKTRRAKKTRGHQHPELVGLVLTAVGLFLATVIYLGWSGGRVGGWLAHGLDAVIGGAVYYETTLNNTTTWIAAPTGGPTTVQSIAAIAQDGNVFVTGYTR